MWNKILPLIQPLKISSVLIASLMSFCYCHCLYDKLNEHGNLYLIKEVRIDGGKHLYDKLNEHCIGCIDVVLLL